MMPDLTAALTGEDLACVMDNMTVRTYHKCAPIYTEGESPSQFMCLLSGKVKIFKDGVGGRSQIVRVVRSVDYFSYRAAFCNEQFVTSAAAFEESVIACIPIPLIKSLIMRNTQLAWFFVQKLALALGKSDERTVNLTQKHIRGRLAESILFLKDNYGMEEDGRTLNIHLSREDMASLSNMTTANAIRHLSTFASEKLIALDGRRIMILNEPELQRISKFG